MIKNKSIVACIFFFLFCLGCPSVDPTPPKPDPKPEPKPDPIVVIVVDETPCGLACSRLRELGCVEADPIDMKTPCKSSSDCLSNQVCGSTNMCLVTCEQFCKDTMNNKVDLDVECVQKITKCDQLNSCPLPE